MKPYSHLGFLRSYLLPAMLLFAIPAVGAWFSGHAIDSLDGDVLSSIESQIRTDTRLGEAARQGEVAFYRANPVSGICTSSNPEFAQLRSNLAEVCSDFWQFEVLRSASLGAIVLGLFSGLFVVLCALAAFVSRPAQYLSFVAGWNFLRLASCVQVVAQGVILVLLSFWMTALWTGSYYPKLIIVVAVAALMAVGAVIRGIFRRPQENFPITAESLDDSQAKALWARVREIAAEVGTEAPAQILVGIDDNFFVTEGDLQAGRGDASTLKPYTGRTLYLSLSLLRVLERAEADAILAHEMGHFSGGDTEHSQKLVPVMTRYGHYLGALQDGLLTLPIFFFMLAYRSLFELSLGRSSREREFRADGIAAELSSAEATARALLKVAAYASYRNRVEQSLFAEQTTQTELGIAARVQTGFAQYVSTEDLIADVHDKVIPHPFDTHPALAERLVAIGVEYAEDDYAGLLLAPVAGTWLDGVEAAVETEAALWQDYEERFAAAHEIDLTYRYLPRTDEERDVVEKFFPAQEFERAGQLGPVSLDYEGLENDDWDRPVPFERIKSADVNERLFKRYLDLKVTKIEGGTERMSIELKKVSVGEAAFLQAFQAYWQRDTAARAWDATQPERSEGDDDG